MVATSKNPWAFCHEHRTGAFFAYLTKKYDNACPKELRCGTNFRVTHKGVKLFNKYFKYPFDLSDFEQYYLSLSEKPSKIFDDIFPLLNKPK